MLRRITDLILIVMPLLVLPEQLKPHFVFIAIPYLIIIWILGYISGRTDELNKRRKELLESFEKVK